MFPSHILDYFSILLAFETRMDLHNVRSGAHAKKTSRIQMCLLTAYPGFDGYEYISGYQFKISLVPHVHSVLHQVLNG